MNYINNILKVLNLNQIIPFLMVVFAAICVAALVVVLINRQNDTYITSIKISPFKIELKFSERNNPIKIKSRKKSKKNGKK